MSDHLVRVYATPNVVEAQLMRGRLEADGIQVLLKGADDLPYPVGPSYIWVTAGDEQRARAIVEAVTSGAFEDDTAEVEPAEVEPAEFGPEG